MEGLAVYFPMIVLIYTGRLNSIQGMYACKVSQSEALSNGCDSQLFVFFNRNSM
jgi:hypothetical protein